VVEMALFVLWVWVKVQKNPDIAVSLRNFFWYGVRLSLTEVEH
jgi:hypothetical protein